MRVIPSGDNQPGEKSKLHRDAITIFAVVVILLRKHALKKRALRKHNMVTYFGKLL